MASRLLMLDTETTGLDIIDNTGVSQYHRITEIGVVEVIDGEITGQRFHTYLNPKREVSFTAYKITGLNYEFLKDKPTFDKVADDFLRFISNSKLVIHNAKFDLKFLNFELSLVNKRNLDPTRVIDTLTMARTKYPGQKASLDALCKKFGIDNSQRTFHGALMDAQLLARVYMCMEGFASQMNMFSSHHESSSHLVKQQNSYNRNLKVEIPTQEERKSHEAIIQALSQ